MTDADASKPATNGAAKARSETTYPYYGLPAAIAVVQAVRRAGGNDAPSPEVMREMGVKKVTDRQWAYGIPAATQFGLIERVGRGDEGRIKLTELANRIVLPTNNDEARAAKVAAFKTPELYATLLEKFAGHPQPTKDGLKNLLHRDYGIVESMAPNAAEAFLESLKEADLVNSSNIVVGTASAPAASAPPKHDDGKADEEHNDRKTKTITVPADFIVYRCKITNGRVIEIPLPATFSMTDVTRLYNFLKTQIDEDPAADAGQEP
jgi:ribosomal protein L12E/L44/L45/RPP1/RPP2